MLLFGQGYLVRPIYIGIMSSIPLFLFIFCVHNYYITWWAVPAPSHACLQCPTQALQPSQLCKTYIHSCFTWKIWITAGFEPTHTFKPPTLYHLIYRTMYFHSLFLSLCWNHTHPCSWCWQHAYHLHLSCNGLPLCVSSVYPLQGHGYWWRTICWQWYGL